MNKDFDLQKVLEKVLKQDARFVSQDGYLLKNTIREKAEKLDENLISLLLENDDTRKVFFKPIKDVIVFDSKKFVQFVNNKEFLPDSYTSFKNKIGLTNKSGDYISSSNEVVLSFPFKDCVLAGGQDKEDSKRQETFYNEILGQDEIDRLLDDKVFTNHKRIDKNGEKSLCHSRESGNLFFNKDKELNKKRGLSEDTITDNLIIKGNNLLALHSLKKQFSNKVKLIYIDPPYNTGNDSFGYNDRFNHSTWLTFMKNRLEVAKDLLKDDGVIFVSVDDNEQAYLKVLMDEVFGTSNFINNICVKSRGGISNDKIISNNHNFILFYSKNYDSIFKIRNYFGIKKTGNDFKNYNKDDNDGNGKYALNPVTGPGGASKGNPYYEFLGIKNYWRFGKERMKKMYDEGLIIKTNNTLYQKTYKKNIENNLKTISTWWDDKNYSTSIGTNEIKDLFNIKNASDFFKNPKPENLIARIIELSTNPGDIVLDYHLGSGTTTAVAHKMGRQYIGIEQMDYIQDITVERMKKVINGEKGGISKSINWQGGGDFVYMETMESNQIFVDKINKSQDKQVLLDIYSQIKQTGFINYDVDIKTIDENIQEFENLSIDHMKKFLIELLDKNLLYVNYSEMNDETYNIDDEDKKLNDLFYKG